MIPPVTRRILQGALALAAAAALFPAAGGAAGTPTITAAATRPEIQFEKTTKISGTYTIDGTTPAAGQVITLEVNPYPYKGWSPVATTTADTAGAYAFTIKGDRNSRYRVRRRFGRSVGAEYEAFARALDRAPAARRRGSRNYCLQCNQKPARWATHDSID